MANVTQARIEKDLLTLVKVEAVIHRMTLMDYLSHCVKLGLATEGVDVESQLQRIREAGKE